MLPSTACVETVLAWSLAAPPRVAVGVIHHDQHEGECEDRDDDDGDNVGCGS